MIEADKDMILVDKDGYGAKLLYLGCNDSPDNYKEITDAEAEAIKAEQDRLAEEERKKHETNE